MTFQGIGTHWWIKIFDNFDEDYFQQLKLQVNFCIKDFENLYSRFISTSFISRLNINKYLVNPSEELISLLELGISTNKVTKGHFNLTVGKILENMGYDSEYSFQSKEEIYVEDYIKIDKNNVVIGPNTKIDLGGIGKGFLINKLKLFLEKAGVRYYFINGGGDIYATSNKGKPIEFVLENPFNLSEIIGKINIKNQSIASSSSSRRKWIDLKNGVTRNHLVNMITKQNITDVVAVYVQGNNSISADISSTAIFVSPKSLYLEISNFFHIEYLVVLNDKTYLKSKNYTGELFI